MLDGIPPLTTTHEELRRLLDEQTFETLFIEHLGWDNPPKPARTVVLGEDGVAGEQIAAKRGVGVWRIDGIPSSVVRRRVDVEVSRHTRERLLIFVEGHEQLWLWPEQRTSGTGVRLVEHRYYNGARNEALLQRLASASFSLEQEESLTVMDVLSRVRRSFNADEVTKRFYREFKKQHDDLLDDVEGIDDDTHLSWYGSVLLNRLMFIYFMQKKGFLADDRDYLRNRLQMVRRHLGADSFYGFFRQFLLPLFHDGLGSHLHPYTDPAIARIIGDVPYVNGGIFSPHLLETTYEIDVPDRAFEEIFQFFDRYRWHLDERPSDDPNEINPDVLGYIFEQYVNQKEQGAYYTKEDVTGYMTGATVIPAFLDRMSAGEEPWVLLTIDPDRYIYESVRYGVEEPLPNQIASGLADLADRGSWSEKAPPSHGLPGETWWEVIDRHRHYRNLRARLESGEIRSVDEAITANLDLRTLADDYLRTLAPLQSVEDAYAALKGLTILDPTCGSGAFLFAALEILEDLYEALLDRAGELHGGEAFSAAREAEKHPNRSYFILKSALLNNLYGVDIMHEAGEIARLRLFLKLVAQLSRRDELEPLPDLDFNIRTGNLLVGIVDVHDARERLGADLFGLAQLENIERTAAEAGAAFEAFVRSQSAGLDPDETHLLKVTVAEQLAGLRDDLDLFLHQARGESIELDEWVESHQPFHWFVEFPRVFQNGGFDVVVGNPPYVNRNKVSYSWRGLATNDLPDIYAPCVERSLSVLDGSGRFSMILPISFQFSNDFTAARNVTASALAAIWVSTFSRNPAALFSAGLGVRSTIVVGTRVPERGSAIRTSRLNRWVDDFRPHLFDTLRYTSLPDRLTKFGWPRVQSDRMAVLLDRMVAADACIRDVTDPQGAAAVRFKTTALYYLSVFLEDPPSFELSGKPIPQTKVGTLNIGNRHDASSVVSVLLSKLALIWWAATSDDFDVTGKGLCSTPVGPASLGCDAWDALALIGERIQHELSNEVIYTKYAGKWMGNYDVKFVRHLTDEADRVILSALGLEDYWPEVELFYAAFLKVTGERPGTTRELPDFAVHTRGASKSS